MADALPLAGFDQAEVTHAIVPNSRELAIG
jgi:hypothetical protein